MNARRPVPALLAGLAFCVRAAVAQEDKPPEPLRPPASWTEYKTEHYTLHSGAAREQAKELGDFMELVHKTYTALLIKGAPPKPPKDGHILFQYGSRAEYLKADWPPEFGAFYRTETAELVGFYHPVLMRPFFAHEGMHQFCALTIPNFKDLSVPMWFTEGIADCIGNSVEREGKLYMCSMTGVIASMRLPLIRDAVAGNRHIPLEKLLTLNRKAFMADAGLAYAESWSFCHFLMTAPKKEDPAKQIPDGKYRRVVSVFYESMLDPRNAPDVAWTQAMQAGKIKSVAALEDEWKAYVLELGKPDPKGPYLGVRADASRYGEGVHIAEVVAGSPADKGGLRVGDAIVKFAGKPVEFWNDFLSFLHTKKAGDKIVLTVVRGGRMVEVTITLEKRGER